MGRCLFHLVSEIYMLAKGPEGLCGEPKIAFIAEAATSVIR